MNTALALATINDNKTTELSELQSATPFLNR